MDYNSTRPLGLQNIGNTCWFNSFVQSLLSLGIKFKITPLGPNPSKDELSRFAINYAFNQLIATPGPVANPRNLHKAFMLGIKTKYTDAALRRFGKNCTQEDALEGMGLMIDLLDEKNSDIAKIFQHRYKAAVHCTDCEYVSKHVVDRNNFIKISTEALNGIKPIKFEDYIIRHTVDIPDYKCGSCKYDDCCERIYKLAYAPPVIVIILEKYSGKKLIDFPMEFTINKNNPLEYKLMAQIEHSGSQHGGHYWAICRRGNAVYELNDGSIQPSEFGPTRYTYALFYAR